MLLQNLFESQGYHVKNNSVYGKVLAYDGQTVLADHDKASMLADKFNGSLIKSMDGRRYIIKLSEAPPQAVKENDAEKSSQMRYDPELAAAKKFAAAHYSTLDPDAAMEKYLQRGMKHSEEDDDRQDDQIKALTAQVADLQNAVNQLKKEHSRLGLNNR